MIRFPTDFHAMGVDTFYIAGHAQSVVDHKRIGWILHPLSYFGLFPASIASGGPVVFAELASLSGIPAEPSILLSDMVLTVLAALSTFLLGRALTGNPSLGLLMSAIYTLSPRLLVYTQASGSTRSFILAIVPVALLLVIRAYRSGSTRSRDLALLMCLLVILLTFHRSGLLVLFFLPAFVIAVHARNWIINSLGRRLLFAAVYLFSLTGMLFAQLVGVIPGPFLIESGYASGAIFTGDNLPILFANMILDYGSSLGVAALFVPIGFLTLLTARPQFEGMFVLFVLLCMGWVLGQGQYAILLVLVPLAAMAVWGFARSVSRVSSKKLMVALLASLLVAATAASALWMVGRWSEASGEALFVDETLVNSAVYLRDRAPGGFFISNDWSSASYKVWSISGNPPLTWSLDPPVIEGVILPGELGAEFSPGGRGLYATSVQERTDWVAVMTQDPRTPVTQQVLARYDLKYFLEDTTYTNPPTTIVFLDEVHESQYKLYANERYVLWTLPRSWG